MTNPSPRFRSEAERARFTWNALLWALVFPQRAHRILPTIPGTVLIALSLGIGMAAYNSSSNILFLTLALLLTCLILSGVLSWLNLRKVEWGLKVPPALRVGHDALVTLRLRNGKRFLPTYGLWFNFTARPQRPAEEQRAETTFTARGADIRAALQRAEAEEVRARVVLAERLEANGEAALDWVLRPVRRGWLRVELSSVGSLFPFGFLRKDIGVSLATQAVVWPAPVEYRRHGLTAARRENGDDRATRPGGGNDLLAVRRYAAGDSHRMIHWKASARTRQLLVRQYAAESAVGYNVWLRTEVEVWKHPEQFELLMSFAATLCEDLFRSERLQSVAINEEPAVPLRRIRDLEQLLNRLALLQPIPAPAARAVGRGGNANLLTFSPDGVRGVAAHLDGQLAASV